MIEPTVCAEVHLPFNRPTAKVYHGKACLTEQTLSINDMKDFCPDDHGSDKWEIPVRCSPIKAYMDEARVDSENKKDKTIGRTIDFMSIDVEQYYMSALKSIPFDDYNIRVIVVECKTEECYGFLRSKDYLVLPAGSIKQIPDDAIAWKNDCLN